MEQEKMTSPSNKWAISCVKRPGECVLEHDVFLAETFLLLLLTLGHIIVEINKLDMAKDKINQ